MYNVHLCLRRQCVETVGYLPGFFFLTKKIITKVVWKRNSEKIFPIQKHWFAVQNKIAGRKLQTSKLSKHFSCGQSPSILSSVAAVMPKPCFAFLSGNFYVWCESTDFCIFWFPDFWKLLFHWKKIFRSHLLLVQ